MALMTMTSWPAAQQRDGDRPGGGKPVGAARQREGLGLLLRVVVHREQDFLLGEVRSDERRDRHCGEKGRAKVLPTPTRLL